jgi:hypothetical protein
MFSSTSASTSALSNNHVSEYMHTILLPLAIVSRNHDYISKLGIWVFDTHSYQLWYSIWYPARVWCFVQFPNTHPHSGLNPRSLLRSQGPRMGYSSEPSTLGSKSWFWNIVMTFFILHFKIRENSLKFAKNLLKFAKNSLKFANFKMQNEECHHYVLKAKPRSSF